MTPPTTPRTDTFTLRAARPGDLPRIEQLLTAAGLPIAGVADCLDDFTVAEAGDALAGVAGLEVRDDVALLRSVAVQPDWRDRGVGRALVHHVIAGAEARGLHALYLLTTTADRYFPSFGFARTTRDAVPAAIRDTAEFRGICPDSAVVMACPLGSAARAASGR